MKQTKNPIILSDIFPKHSLRNEPPQAALLNSCATVNQPFCQNYRD
jgi:hypothetical protein